jgi:hypothetical protein
MQVNLNLNSAGAVGPSTSPLRRNKAAQNSDAAEFNGAAALDQSLTTTPGVRPEVIARARELVAQPDYPPAETMRKIAALLAFNIDQSR